MGVMGDAAAAQAQQAQQQALQQQQQAMQQQQPNAFGWNFFAPQSSFAMRR